MASSPFGNAARVASQPNVKPVRSTIVCPWRLQNYRASNMFASDYVRAFFLFLFRVTFGFSRVARVNDTG